MLWLYLLFIQCESVSTIQALNYGDVTFLKGRKKREGDRKKEREREGKSYFLEKFIGDLSSCRQEKKHKNVHLKKIGFKIN
jgi:hypothetical protein